MSFSHIKSTARWTVLSVLYIDIPEPPVVLLFPGKEEPCFFLQGLGLDAPALLFPNREQLNGVRTLTLQGAGNLITEAFQAHRCHLVTDPEPVSQPQPEDVYKRQLLHRALLRKYAVSSRRSPA